MFSIRRLTTTMSLSPNAMDWASHHNGFHFPEGTYFIDSCARTYFGISRINGGLSSWSLSVPACLQLAHYNFLHLGGVQLILLFNDLLIATAPSSGAVMVDNAP